MKLHIFPVTERGYGLARKIKRYFKNTVVYRPSELKQGGFNKRVKEAFRVSGGLVFVSAVAVAVRTIAPFLKGKHKDPPVVVIDELGRFAVSVISGHLGGANELSKTIAGLIGATPVITTATDLHGLPCIEDIAKRFSFEIEDVKRIKQVNSAILRWAGKGARVKVVDRNPARLNALKKAFGPKGVFMFQRSIPKRLKGDTPLVVISSRLDEKVNRSVTGQAISKRTLFLRPREFVMGLGCKKGVTIKEVERACREVLIANGISPLSVRNLATIDIKRDEPGITGFAERVGRPVEFFSSKELARIRPPSGPSRVVKENIGVGGVAEPATLLSSETMRIWIKKQKKGRVTVAVAKVPKTFQASKCR
jgi:cobalt-precorrin 5A hydrolase